MEWSYFNDTHIYKFALSSDLNESEIKSYVILVLLMRIALDIGPTKKKLAFVFDTVFFLSLSPSHFLSPPLYLDFASSLVHSLVAWLAG